MNCAPPLPKWSNNTEFRDCNNALLKMNLNENFQGSLPLLSGNVTPPLNPTYSPHSSAALSPTDSGNHTPNLMGNLPQWNSSQEVVESHKLAPLPSPVRQASSYKDDMNSSSVDTNNLKPNISVSPTAGKPAAFSGVQAARQLQPSKQPTPLPKYPGKSGVGVNTNEANFLVVPLKQEKPTRRLSQHVAIADCSMTMEASFDGGASARKWDNSETSVSPCSYGSNTPPPPFPLGPTSLDENTIKSSPDLLATLLKGISSTSEKPQAAQISSDARQNSNKEERNELFRQLKSVSALLTHIRERQTQTNTGALHSSQQPQGETEGVPVNDPEFYYTELTDEEEKLIDTFLFEANEIKTRIGTKHGIDTVQGSWALVVKSPRLKEFKQDLYNALIDEHILIPKLISELPLADRAQVLFKILNTAVDVYGKPREIVDFLMKAGATHLCFGIAEKEFFVMRNAVIRLLPKYLPAEVVEASAKDWSRFWGLAINLMKQGGNTPEGQMNRKLYEEDFAKQIQTLVHGIRAKQDQLPLEKHFVNVMFDICRTICPHLEKFRLLFNNRRHCDRFYDSVIMIADNITNPEKKAEHLEQLGGRHVAYGVSRTILEECEKPFILAAREMAGEDAWNLTVQHNCELFYRTTVNGIAAGMDHGKDTAANRWAPDGSEPFCLLFTDVESSTNLWQRYPTIMREAIDKHHRIIRTVIADFGGYEVKTAGDSFIIAVKDVLAGLKIAVAIQLELMRQVPIAEGFEMLDDVQGHGDPEAWNKQTLRVRIGIQHCTDAVATYDGIHRRYDYYGTSVNQCARIEAAAAGGQILMSRETFKALKAIPAFHDEPCPAFLRDIDGNSELDERGFDHFVAMCDVDKVKLKGIKRPVRLVSVVPVSLSGRDFSDAMAKSSFV